MEENIQEHTSYDVSHFPPKNFKRNIYTYIYKLSDMVMNITNIMKRTPNTDSVEK